MTMSNSAMINDSTSNTAVLSFKNSVAYVYQQTNGWNGLVDPSTISKGIATTNVSDFIDQTLILDPCTQFIANNVPAGILSSYGLNSVSSGVVDIITDRLLMPYEVTVTVPNTLSLNTWLQDKALQPVDVMSCGYDLLGMFTKADVWIKGTPYDMSKLEHRIDIGKTKEESMYFGEKYLFNESICTILTDNIASNIYRRNPLQDINPVKAEVVYGYDTIKKKGSLALVEQPQGLSVIYTNGTIPAITTNVIYEEKAFIMNPCSTLVQYAVGEASFSSQTVFNYVTIQVDSDRPVNTGGSTVTGGGLQSFYFVFQKQAYSEIDLIFGNLEIASVIGLPPGMQYINKQIKGSPTDAGKYPVTIQFTNKAIMEGVIQVPNITRIM